MAQVTSTKNGLLTHGVVMPETPTPQRIYPSQDGTALIICPQCMKRVSLNASAHMYSQRILKVGCRCGHQFPVVFDTRKFHRKRIHLPGQYVKLSNGSAKLITIQDLSYSGIRFKTRFLHRIQVDDVLTIDFILDNQRNSRISKAVQVIHVQGRVIGAEFQDRRAHSAELLEYLNDS